MPNSHSMDLRNCYIKSAYIKRHTFWGGIWSPPNADTQGLIPPVPKAMRKSPTSVPITISVWLNQLLKAEKALITCPKAYTIENIKMVLKHNRSRFRIVLILRLASDRLPCFMFSLLKKLNTYWNLWGLTLGSNRKMIWQWIDIPCTTLYRMWLWLIS